MIFVIGQRLLLREGSHADNFAPLIGPTISALGRVGLLLPLVNGLLLTLAAGLLQFLAARLLLPVVAGLWLLE